MYMSPIILMMANRYSFLLLTRFHSGFLAFGVLIIAIVQLARIILAYIQKGRAGKVAQCLLCCL